MHRTNGCVFLDRDGTINVTPSPGTYIRRWSEFKFLPNIADWIRLFNKLNLIVIVITNQRGVARGLMTEEDLQEIHRRMVEALSVEDAHITDIFYCPHAESSCKCRKPQPGLIWMAQHKWKIDLSRSLLIGDTDTDAELARTCGIEFLRAQGGRLVPPY